MDNIIFRGKRRDQRFNIDEWVYGNLVLNWFRELAVSPPYITTDAGDIYCVVKKSIAQYTGLKDKNGNEIFGSIPIEGKMSKGGDILKYNITSKKDGILVAKIPDIFYEEESDMSGFFSDDSNILGNLFDNPELLEAK